MTNKRTILIVEDNAKLRSANRSLLQDEGYDVVTAGSIREAREVLESPAIISGIVLDIRLPDGDAFELLFPDLRDKYRIPTMFLTCKRSSKSQCAALRAGGFDYMTKPFDNDVFCVRVTRMLTMTQADRQKEFVAKYSLTETELNIALRIARKMLVKEVAAEMFISDQWVKNTLTALYKKLNITAPDRMKRKILADMLEEAGLVF